MSVKSVLGIITNTYLLKKRFAQLFIKTSLKIISLKSASNQ